MAGMLTFVLVATFITQGTAQGESIWLNICVKCMVIDTCTVAGEFEMNLDSSVSICLSSPSDLKWTKVCYSGWTITHAKLACKQNSMDFQGTHTISIHTG